MNEYALHPAASIFIAIAGGMVYDFVVAGYNYRRTKTPESFLTEKYWWSGVAMWIVGGALAFLHAISGPNLSPFVALHIGVATPAIARGMVGGFSEDKEGLNQDS